MMGVYFLQTVSNGSGVLIHLFYIQLKVLHLQSEQLFLCLINNTKGNNFYWQ